MLRRSPASKINGILFLACFLEGVWPFFWKVFTVDISVGDIGGLGRFIPYSQSVGTLTLFIYFICVFSTINCNLTFIFIVNTVNSNDPIGELWVRNDDSQLWMNRTS